MKNPNLLDAKLTLAMRTPMEANGKASFDICESSWVAHFQEDLESLLQTCVFIVMLYMMLWWVEWYRDSISAWKSCMMKVYHIKKHQTSIHKHSQSVLGCRGVAVKNVPNCFTRNSFADYVIDKSFVATLSPTFMIQWEMCFSNLASSDWWIYTSKQSNQANFLMKGAKRES